MDDQGEKFELQKHLPPDRVRSRSMARVDATELGTEPILYMTGFHEGICTCGFHDGICT
jgi:hypothetical protein